MNQPKPATPIDHQAAEAAEAAAIEREAECLGNFLRAVLRDDVKPHGHARAGVVRGRSASGKKQKRKGRTSA